MESSPPSLTIQVYLNGLAQDCPANLAMTDFLEAIGLNPKLLAVEYNGEILHRQFWSETIVQNGDHLEIVTIVGGGWSWHFTLDVFLDISWSWVDPGVIAAWDHLRINGSQGVTKGGRLGVQTLLN